MLKTLVLLLQGNWIPPPKKKKKKKNCKSYFIKKLVPKKEIICVAFNTKLEFFCIAIESYKFYKIHFFWECLKKKIFFGRRGITIHILWN